MDRKQRLFVYLTGVFVAALLVSDLIGGKFFRVAGLDFSVGMIPFPLTFLLTDIVNEFYGTEGARRLTYVGLVTAIFVFTVINVAIALPTSPESPLAGDVFKNVIGSSVRLYIASLVAYLVGQLLDISIFLFVRRVTGERFLWLRSTGSTVVSQAIDSLVVNFVFLSGSKSMVYILRTARNNYLVKLALAIGLTPLIYLGHGILHRYLHVREVLVHDPVPPEPGDELLPS
ncbi:MAG TPA: queuosine precursor transporter [Polyangia bacterium]|nr:queuosine precursor transporter [Polyangia bacterium]